jgi:hypothetical protein
MKFPDSFPAGCTFVTNFSDDFVRFPDGAWFKMSDDGASLVPMPGMDPRGPATGAPISEARFVGCAATSRAFEAGGMDAVLSEKAKAAS